MLLGAGVLAQQLLHGGLQGFGRGHATPLVHGLEVDDIDHQLLVVGVIIRVQLRVAFLDPFQGNVVAGGLAGTDLRRLGAHFGLGLDDLALGLADLRHQRGGLLDFAVGQERVVLPLHSQDAVLQGGQLLVGLGDLLPALVLGQALLQGLALLALLGQDLLVAVQWDASVLGFGLGGLRLSVFALVLALALVLLPVLEGVLQGGLVGFGGFGGLGRRVGGVIVGSDKVIAAIGQADVSAAGV